MQLLQVLLQQGLLPFSEDITNLALLQQLPQSIAVSLPQLSSATIRELAISPLLVQISPLNQHASKRQSSLSTSEKTSKTTIIASEDISWSSLRTHNLLDSGLSGAVTGGLIRGLKSGPRSIPSGSITTGLICTLLQYGYNELATSRLRYISKLREEKAASMDSTLAPVPTTPFSQRLLRLIGVVPLSDEEYLAKMKKTREIYLRKIRELERQKLEEKDDK